MKTRRIHKADFDHIVSVIDRWWGGPYSAAALPIFFYELGHHAQVIEEQGETVGFLLGFVADQPVKTGYVHLAGIHPEFRRKGVGRKLYASFEAECKNAGCIKMKAITTLGNEGSVKFHQGIGWKVEEVSDYAGPGRTRIVFTKTF
ncbi:MAG: GNAT family N-acetyltransferase [Polyangiaceae bacterium]|nr:GNAT family N-acetyltransferase [Polyangiaceae bacterium]